MRLSTLLAVAFFLCGCVSTEMRTFVGKPIEEATMAYGDPEQVLQLSDGRRAYIYRRGGGARVIPSQGYARIAPRGDGVTTIATTATPAMIYEQQGCRMTFIASDRDGDGFFTIEEFRTPRELVCPD